MKECNKCKKKKILNEYRKDKNGKHGVRGSCKDCENSTRINRSMKRKHDYLFKIIYDNIPYFKKKLMTDNNFFAVLEYEKQIDFTNIDKIKDDLIQCIALIVKQIEVKVSIEVNYIMMNKDNKTFILSKRTDKKDINDNNYIKNIDNMIENINEMINESHYEESGLTIIKIDSLLLYINPYIISLGGSYVELPQNIIRSQACINVKNKDNNCFLWSILAYYHVNDKLKNPSRLAHYKKSPFLEKLDTSMLIYPVDLNQITEFESKNKLRINVYKLLNDDKTITNIYLSEKNEYQIINLLLYKNHYILIKNINRLLAHTNDSNRCFICIYCGSDAYTKKIALYEHEEKCKYRNEKQKYSISKDTYIEYIERNYNKRLKYIIYCDFESYFENTDKNNTSKTSFRNMHMPLAFGIKIVSNIENNNVYDNNVITYVGEDADKKYVEYLKTIVKDISLTEKNDLTIPVVFHNLEGYDIHLFIDELSLNSKNIKVIPKSKEKYLSIIATFNNISNIHLKFIDSLHFLTGSLEENAKKLEKFKFIKDVKLTKKQIFPYSFITSISSLDCQYNELFSNKQIWYNDLKKCEISDDDFIYASEIFKEYKCKNLLDYTLLYLKTDVLLLAEIFENFRDISLNTYQLDPAYYHTTYNINI
jgi:hypothetical protein